jgi:hypothetical protein
MTWFKTLDTRFSWLIKVRERFTIEPSIAVFNTFNFANFNAAGHTLNGIMDGSAGSINGTTVDAAGLPGGRNSVRTGLGTGVNSGGAPRQIEWGLKLIF